MAVLNTRSGAKVGWITVDNREEAERLAAEERTRGFEKEAQGYDFGYQVIGQITDHGDGTYTVTTT